MISAACKNGMKTQEKKPGPLIPKTQIKKFRLIPQVISIARYIKRPSFIIIFGTESMFSDTTINVGKPTRL